MSTTHTKTPPLDEYWTALEQAALTFTAEEQRAAVTLYHELARGAPVTAAQFAKALDVPPANAEELLRRRSIKAFTYLDEQRRVAGFGGLAVAPMHHTFRVDGRTLWTWCAWDSLFIPEVLNRTAQVESPDPETGEVVRLVVAPHHVESVEPPGAVVSFVLPGELDWSAANVMASFCHFVFFFASVESGERWATKHPGTFLYSLDEAFELARRLNGRNFAVELAQRASVPREPRSRVSSDSARS